MDTNASIQTRLIAVRERIAQAELRFGREPGAVQLLAVSKTFSVECILGAIRAGQQQFGENYFQEAQEKIADGRLSAAAVEWHYIGPVQGNKAARIACVFDWVHTVDKPAIAERLNQQRPAHLPPLNICLQVNVSAESTKGGVSLDQLPGLAVAMLDLPRLRLRGLMAIPKPAADFAQQRLPFRALRKAFDQLRATGLALDTLSMGMSDDLEAAIAEGATLVRVGTAIFGARQASEVL
ncbi:MAG: YggS family pyridoxal phosphate-dependent enzyme [Gammaproteobacteria bacterium]